MEVQNIPIRLIEPSPLNPRKTIDEGAVTELSESIMTQGLLHWNANATEALSDF